MWKWMTREKERRKEEKRKTPTHTLPHLDILNQHLTQKLTSLKTQPHHLSSHTKTLIQLNANAPHVAIAPTVTAVAVCAATEASLLARL
jgi:hypothetical protein